MYNKLYQVVAGFTFLLLASSAGMGQVATGTYSYGTFDSNGPDTINVGNLNVHFSFPVLNKAGRGLPFYYNLSYDSSVWYPSSVTGSLVWTPMPLFGWKGDTEVATGYLSYQTKSGVYPKGDPNSPCPNDLDTYTIYSNWTYHDPYGIAHMFSGFTENSTCYPTANFSKVATDGSGYELNLSNYTQGSIISPVGSVSAVPNINNGAATITDPNGNQVSTDGSGHFTDTTGKVVLTLAGTAPSNYTLTYTDTTGTSRAVTMTYKTYTVRTAFGCNGIGEYNYSTSLVDSLSFPDGTKYQFSYEPTPGFTGDVTGRLTSIELPQGGSISYSYSGGSNGIVCADGSTAKLTRAFAADSGSKASQRTYTRTPGSGTSHTEVVDGLTNYLEYDFVAGIDSAIPTPVAQAVYYETNRTIYEGAKSGTPVLARNTCYNGTPSPCTTTALSLPIRQTDAYETLDGVEVHGSTFKFNSTGAQTESDVYDFGTSARGPLLSKEVWVYGGAFSNLSNVGCCVRCLG